jgi:CheY-like chemotaxis protein
MGYMSQLSIFLKYMRYIGKFEKILVIDDEESMCKMVSKSLCSAGYDCTTTTVPSNALEMLEGEIFDLVVSDIRMPEMDGVQLLRAIRQRLQEVNVILMAAFSDHYSHSDIVREGADDFIIKSFKLSELILQRNIGMDLCPAVGWARSYRAHSECKSAFSRGQCSAFAHPA